MPWLRVRFLFATLLALALSLLPIGGGANAMGAAPGLSGAMPCHAAAGDPAAPDDKARSCADHCMAQANTPALSAALGQPSIRNAILATPAILLDLRTPRAGDPPETPPPRA